MATIRPAPLALAALVAVGFGCASPPPVGLYGSEPESGDWVEAHRLTMRAGELSTAPDPDTDAIKSLLRRAIEADPTHGPAYLQLGTILEQHGKLDEALWAYAWAHRLMPGYPEAERRLHAMLDSLHHDVPGMAP